MNRIKATDSSTGEVYDYTAPSEWDELDEKQLTAWAAISLKKLDIGNAIRLAMMVLFKIPAGKFFKIPEPQKVQLAPTLSFLFQKNKLLKWVIPIVQIGSWLIKNEKLYGPEDQLSNITIGEFRRTELYYQAYVKSQDLQYLHLLIATLYRPRREGIIDLDVREPLTEYGIRQRAEQIAKLSRKKQQAVLLNYEGCRGYIQENYLSQLPKGKSNDQHLFDFNDIILSVAGSKFGSFAETESAMLYDFLKHLIATAKEVEEIKKKSKA